MQVSVVVSESSQPLNSCHALKRAEYIYTGDMATGDMVELKCVKSHILLSYYKYIRPNIPYCVLGQFMSLCVRVGLCV